MRKKTYSIFGAGAAGLYTAWRLLGGAASDAKQPPKQSKQLQQGDTLELYDWGQYDFSKAHPGTRAAGGRICTWHYQNAKGNSYLELGGMRYSYWDGAPKTAGHRVVTTVIALLGLDKFSVPFNVTENQLYSLRAKNFYLNDISSHNPAPYNANQYAASGQPDAGFTTLQNLAMTPQAAQNMSRSDWCQFYQKGRISADMPAASVFKKGDLLKDIGYWNLMFDQLGSEGYRYAADGNGYSSNVINWNTAVAVQSNNEFAPGTQYKTLTTGYSSIFNALFDAVVTLAKAKGIQLDYHHNTRLHGILQQGDSITYTTATRAQPHQQAAEKTTDAAWLAMPRNAIELVAQATRYQKHAGLDVLNHPQVQLYLESAIMQPSYKVGMFFDTEWWMNPRVVTYPAKLTGFEVTTEVIVALGLQGFPSQYLQDIETDQDGQPQIMGQPYACAQELVQAVALCVGERLTLKQEEQLLQAAKRQSIGPSVTDMPIRQVVYFGNNAANADQPPVYGLLASYDDEQFTSFWQELELGPQTLRKLPLSGNCQPLEGPRKATPVMVNMLRQQLAALHFGPGTSYTAVPEPKETMYMDWSLQPFGAGYHAYAAHYDVCDVQQKVRKPSQLIDGVDANIFIVGETYSNDQAWVEGAFCTAESVLNDFFGIQPIIDPENYPFI